MPQSFRSTAIGIALATSAGCSFIDGAYLNTFYNAEQAYERGVRQRDQAEPAADSLPPAARAEFELAAEKSGIVLTHYPDSDYADDALLLLARSLQALRSHADAASAYRRYVDLFPDGERAPEAWLGLIRSERMAGDLEAARTALAGFLEMGADFGGLEAEVLHEKALIELATGAHDEAVRTFMALVEEEPEYASRRDVTLRFADAERAAGNYEVALDAYRALRENLEDPLLKREVDLRIGRTLVLADRTEEALALYDGIVDGGIRDSLEARVQAERGDLFLAASRWDQADDAYRRAAELAPGTELASRAMLARGRIAWNVRGDREAALGILLDGFIHAPLSAYADTARTGARALERLIHFERLAAGEIVVAGIEDPEAARSTALYRLAEEVLEAESDPEAAAALFARLAREYPGSPWRPGALLAQGILLSGAGRAAEGEAALHELVASHPDTPAADSARRRLGLPVPERPGGFYAPLPELASLSGALPRSEDPMERVVDDLDRYARPAAGRAASTAEPRPGVEPPPGSEPPPGADRRPGIEPTIEGVTP